MPAVGATLGAHIAALIVQDAPQGARGSHCVVYDDAGHALLAHHRPSYRKADTEDGSRHALARFKGARRF